MTPLRVHNGDQSGLFYCKLPNSIYANKANARTLCGAKSMKAKERITLMVCISASGDKCPMLVVGKAANPQCFRFTSRYPINFMSKKTHGL